MIIKFVSKLNPIDLVITGLVNGLFWLGSAIIDGIANPKENNKKGEGGKK